MPRVVAGYKDQARAAIVKAAMKAFAEKGYHEATMDDVASVMGVSKGAIYPYFKSKQELFSEVYREGLVSFRNILQSSFTGGDVLASSRGYYSRIRKEQSLTPALKFELFSEASRNEKLRKIVSEGYQGAIEILRSFLEERKREGVIKEETDTYSLAALLVAVYEGLNVDELIGLEEAELEKVWGDFVEAMFAAHVRLG